jgi:hypothetical protein
MWLGMRLEAAGPTGHPYDPQTARTFSFVVF